MVVFNTSVIILAAGESRRMGSPKLLLPLAGRSLIQCTVDRYLASDATEVVVVAGGEIEGISKVLAGSSVKIVDNPDYADGMSTSILAGLRQINPSAGAVMLALGDQPFVDTATINRILEAFNAHAFGIALPICLGRRGHPVVFDLKYRPDLLKLTGDVGARSVIGTHPDDILEVAVTSKAVLRDIDLPEDYDALGEPRAETC
jgi:molybdenum cofactor cytidylyltransferase